MSEDEGPMMWFFAVLAVVLWVGMVGLVVAAVTGPQDASTSNAAGEP